MGKEIAFGNSEKFKLVLEGMNEFTDAVASTLGPKGRLVFLDRGRTDSESTKDGVTVGDFITFRNKYKRIGANFIKNTAHTVNILTGDGSTTTTILTRGLCVEGFKLVQSGYDPVDIKKGYEAARDDITEAIKKVAQPVQTEDDFIKIATTSANNDPVMGKVVADAYLGVGEGGLVNIFPSKQRSSLTDNIKFSSGIHIKEGKLLHGDFANTSDDKFVGTDPLFFIYGRVLKDFEIVKTIKQMYKNPLVIIAAGYSEEFLRTLVRNCKDKGLSAVAIMPDGGEVDQRQQFLLDYAAQLGAEVIDGIGKVSLDEFDPSKHLGHAKGVEVSIQGTSISDGAGTEEQVAARVAELQEQIDKARNGDEEESKSEYEIDFIKERIAKMTGGIATIYYTAPSDIELNEKRTRYEDAVNAVSHAIQDGYIVGGGAGLIHAIADIQKKHVPFKNLSMERGYQTFLRVLEEPSRIIIRSTGRDPGYVIEKIKNTKNPLYGYNAKTEKESKDLSAEGIIEPATIILTAVLYCASTAGTFITTNCIVTYDTDNVELVANDDYTDMNRSLLGDTSGDIV